MGLPDYLGWNWKSKAGLPIVCIPGCPAQPDNTTETLLYLVFQLAGKAPMIPLDDALRPKWFSIALLTKIVTGLAFTNRVILPKNMAP